MKHDLISQEERIVEQWQNMTITSDPMFGLVMENK